MSVCQFWVQVPEALCVDSLPHLTSPSLGEPAGLWRSCAGKPGYRATVSLDCSWTLSQNVCQCPLHQQPACMTHSSPQTHELAQQYSPADQRLFNKNTCLLFQVTKFGQDLLNNNCWLTLPMKSPATVGQGCNLSHPYLSGESLAHCILHHSYLNKLNWF